MWKKKKEKRKKKKEKRKKKKEKRKKEKKKKKKRKRSENHLASHKVRRLSSEPLEGTGFLRFGLEWRFCALTALKIVINLGLKIPRYERCRFPSAVSVRQANPFTEIFPL